MKKIKISDVYLVLFILVFSMVLIGCDYVSFNTPVRTEDQSQVTGVVETKVTMKEIETEIFKITDASACSKYRWKERGSTYKSYYRGMGLTYAKAYCAPDAIVSSARGTPESKFDTSDVLSWYNSNFNSIGLKNDLSGKDTQRNVWTLLFGLGMRESSGRYCTGRDMSADYSTANSAEAGLFQASYGSKRSSPELIALFEKYKKSKEGCFLDTFKVGFTCSESNLKNWGTGEGVEWQKLTKECPAFSAEWAAILVRKSGGTKGEFGPLRTKRAELNKDCGLMLQQIDSLIERNKNYCDLLK